MIPISEEDSFVKIKANMLKTNRYDVMNSDGCSYLRDNGLGIYCMLGTRKVRRINKDGKDLMVCLDCDAGRSEWLEITKEEFESIEKKQKVDFVNIKKTKKTKSQKEEKDETI